MSPDEALAKVLKQNPRSAIIISENANGDLALTVGPDMSMEHVNFLLKQVEHFIVWQSMNAPRVSRAGLEASNPPAPADAECMLR